MMSRKHYIEFADMISDLIDNRNFNATKFKEYIHNKTGYELR